MSIKFTPNPTASANALPQPSGSAKALSGQIMAPASLTPLSPPATGAAPAPAPAAQDKGIAAERRQAFFAGHQQALLNRLGSSPMPAPAGSLSAAQRAACVAVLRNIAGASAE